MEEMSAILIVGIVFFCLLSIIPLGKIWEEWETIRKKYDYSNTRYKAVWEATVEYFDTPLQWGNWLFKAIVYVIAAFYYIVFLIALLICTVLWWIICLLFKSKGTKG